MARPTYRTRLEALIANPAISARDKDFAQSLLSFYERKGRLSAGRVKWVATLEERYSPENLAAGAAKNSTMLARLNALHARTEAASWAAGFVESLVGQVTADRRLSERQLQILKKIPRYIAETGLIIGIFLFVIWQLSRGTLAEGLIAVGIFMAGSFRMMGAILPLQALWNELRVQQNWVSQAQEILLTLKDQPELLDPRPFSATRSRTVTLATSRFDGGVSVEMREVSFTHVGSDEETIKNVTLSIPAGKFAAFVGPSGAGKTTIVDLLLGLHEPDSGKVELAGALPVDIRDKHPGMISYVPQKPGLVSGSFASNVALGVAPEDIDEDLVRDCLRKAELLEFVENLPDGIHSSLGSQADSLSGGQAQRLGLARALYPQPRFVILDEATSALDASTEASIAEGIRNIGSDTTVLVVAHRLSTIQHADVVFVIDEGRVIAQGTFPEVRKQVPMIEEYVRLMSFDDE